MNKTLLRNVARAWGLQPSYINNQNEVVWSPEKTLLRVLEDLTQKPAQSDKDLKTLLTLRRKKYLQDGLEKSLVFWDGKPRSFYLYLPLTENQADRNLQASLHLENHTQQNVALRILEERKRKDFLRLKVDFKETLPLGYHRLEVKTSQSLFTSLLICAPSCLQARPELKNSWGPFVPMYALRSGHEWGIGSLQELTEASKLCHDFGAKWVGTLPLLAANFDHQDGDPSPYSALTRLFWNEIYLDVPTLLKKYPLPAAQSLVASAEFQDELAKLRASSHVDYFKVYQLKKKILLLLAENFFAQKLQNSPAYKKFVQENPEIDRYAEFRAEDIAGQNFHRFVQFEMNEALAEIARQNPLGLYMDFPVGVNDAGFDFKEFTSVFFKEVSVGAPPEPVFQQGQDWGFPSFHAYRHRDEGYQYFRKSLRSHLKFCKILRLDHVMGLYRIYAVPKGFSGRDGIYLRFPPEDLFAMVILESDRAGADFVGENLGTVPAAVEKTLRERNLNGMWVLQMESWRKPQEAFTQVPANAMLSFNTHDMPMWASFQKGSDLALVRDLKILGAEYYEEFLQARQKQMSEWKKYFGEKDFTANLHEKLAQSPGKYFVVTLEDLWSEELPQNIPGTWKEYPNWRRKFALRISEWAGNSQTLDILRRLRDVRG